MNRGQLTEARMGIPDSLPDAQRAFRPVEGLFHACIDSGCKGGTSAADVLGSQCSVLTIQLGDI